MVQPKNNGVTSQQKSRLDGYLLPVGKEVEALPGTRFKGLGFRVFNDHIELRGLVFRVWGAGLRRRATI